MQEDKTSQPAFVALNLCFSVGLLDCAGDEAPGNVLVCQSGKVSHIIYGRKFYEEALNVVHTAFRFVYVVMFANHVTHRGFFISNNHLLDLSS